MLRLYEIGKRLFTRMMIPSVLMLFGSMSIEAMADDLFQLLVKLKDSEQKAFLLSQKPLVSFDHNDCVIEYNGINNYFDMGEIEDITIVQGTDGIEDVVIDGITLDYTTPDIAVVRGVPTGVMVTLHTIDGIMLDSVRADDEGNATINLAAVRPSTICFISINSIKNFKILKK